jgi:6-phosphofructokinase 1
MNPLLRALVRVGLNRHGADALGVRDGYAGLVRMADRLESGQWTLASLSEEIDSHGGMAGVARASQDLVRLDHASVSGLLSRGGIMLGSSRCPRFRDQSVRRRVIELLENVGVRSVIACGGDGSLAGAARLAEESELLVIGIPATVDNDLDATELALGFDTAVNTLAWAVGHLADSAVSRQRIVVLEVMGRRSGEQARLAALASGAEIVLTPDRGPLTEDRMRAIAEQLEPAMKRGRRQAILLVAEGVALDRSLAGHGRVSPTVWLAQQLEAYFGRQGGAFTSLEVRHCALGHLQRGGVPSVADRILAARFAESAWKAIVNPGERSGILGLRAGEILLQDFRAEPDPDRIEAARQICRLQKDVSRW